MILKPGDIVKLEKQTGTYSRNAKWTRTGCEVTFGGVVLEGANSRVCHIKYEVRGMMQIGTFNLIDGEWRKNVMHCLAVIKVY